MAGNPRLYGLVEAAEILGVKRNNVYHVVGIEACRYPGGRVKATPLYLADAVDALAEERKQRPQWQRAHRVRT